MTPEEAQPWLAWVRGITYPPMPTNNHHIRLARITTTSPDSQLLAIEVSSVLFEKAPPYEVLSYAWLAHWNLPLSDALVNGRPARIPLNLCTFLRQWHAQRHSHSEEKESEKENEKEEEDVETIWVDALCINQLDDAEKLGQIALMPDIYGNCTIFTIWLGAASRDVEIAFIHLKHLSHTESSFHLSNAEPPVHYSSSPASRATDAPTARSIAQVFQRPWWRRLWIVQEVAFGASSRNLRLARVMCGPLSIAWKVLVLGLAQISGGGDDDLSDGLVRSLEMARKRVARWRIRDGDPTTEGGGEGEQRLARKTMREAWRVEDDRTFLQLYQENLFRRCSDERDRILALLNMVAPNKSYFDVLPVTTVPAREIYHRLVKRVDESDRRVEATWLKNRDSLEFLLEPKNQPGAVATGTKSSSFWGTLDLATQGKMWEMPRQNYHLKPDGSPVLVFSEDGAKLTVKGVILDDMNRSLTLPNVSSSKDLHHVHKSFLSTLHKQYDSPTLQQRLLIWRTLFINSLEFDPESIDKNTAPEAALALGDSHWFSETSQQHREEHCYRGTCSECSSSIGNLLLDTDGHINYDLNPFHPTARPRLTRERIAEVKGLFSSEKSLWLTKTCVPILAVLDDTTQYFQSDEDVQHYREVYRPTHLALLAGMSRPVLLGEIPGEKGCWCIVGSAFLPEGAFGGDNLGIGEGRRLQSITLLARTCARGNV